MSKFTVSEALGKLHDLQSRLELYRIGQPDESAALPQALFVDAEVLNALKVVVDAAGCVAEFLDRADALEVTPPVLKIADTIPDVGDYQVGSRRESPATLVARALHYLSMKRANFGSVFFQANRLDAAIKASIRLWAESYPITCLEEAYEKLVK